MALQNAGEEDIQGEGNDETTSAKASSVRASPRPERLIRHSFQLIALYQDKHDKAPSEVRGWETGRDNASNEAATSPRIMAFALSDLMSDKPIFGRCFTILSRRQVQAAVDISSRQPRAAGLLDLPAELSVGDVAM